MGGLLRGEFALHLCFFMCIDFLNFEDSVSLFPTPHPWQRCSFSFEFPRVRGDG